MVDTASSIISALALAASLSSFVLSLRADRRAKDSVRPYVSTEVSMVPDDLSVSLSNYGAGVAIITKVSLSQNGGAPKKSFGYLLASSSNYEISRAIYFVQKEYCLRPGDTRKMVVANVKNSRKAQDAARDWITALDGITIEVEYLDIFGKRFPHSRVISIKALDGEAILNP
jgi:hypothetical protein